MHPNPRSHYLPRLKREFYQGDSVVYWTLTVFDQRTGWLTDLFHMHFREAVLHVSAREGLFCPTYCLMPDHLHMVWIGLRDESDQLNGMAFFRTHMKSFLAPYKFQRQPHDHVLGDEERKRNAFAKICFYILNNPQKAGLVKEPAAWPYCGAIIPGYPKLHPLDLDYWPKFWRLYVLARSTTSRRLPPRTP